MAGTRSNQVLDIADRTFQAAVAELGQGHLDVAERACRQILEVIPDYAGALHLLGVCAVQRGDFPGAARLLGKAAAAAPDDASIHFLRSHAQMALGDVSGAKASLRAVINRDPSRADARLMLADLLRQSGRSDEAEAEIRALLYHAPDSGSAHTYLGTLLLAAGKFDAAETEYREAIARDAQIIDAHANLGGLLRLSGRLGEAEEVYRSAIKLFPEQASFFRDLAAVLHDLGRIEEAWAPLQKALLLTPDDPIAHTVRGNLLLEAGDFIAARTAYDAAVTRSALPDTIANRGMLRLLTGDMPAGWSDYRARRHGSMAGPPPRQVSAREWNGEPLDGRTILLRAEQGAGDMIQFARYATVLAKQGAKVILEAPDELTALLATVPGVDHVRSTTEPLPPAHYQAMLLDLPGIVGTSLSTIPGEVPYLVADPKRTAALRPAVAGTGLRVGIVSRGNTAHRRDHLRSCPGLFDALAGIPGIDLYSLDYGQPNAVRPNVTDLAINFRDFSDTAAALVLLDLVVTVDTSVAHLAGALGLKTWLLLPYVPDWRWLLERDDSPWYPTMRLWRQKKRTDWDGVLSDVRRQLALDASAR